MPWEEGFEIHECEGVGGCVEDLAVVVVSFGVACWGFGGLTWFVTLKVPKVKPRGGMGASGDSEVIYITLLIRIEGSGRSSMLARLPQGQAGAATTFRACELRIFGDIHHGTQYNMV